MRDARENGWLNEFTHTSAIAVQCTANSGSQYYNHRIVFVKSFVRNKFYNTLYVCVKFHKNWFHPMNIV